MLNDCLCTPLTGKQSYGDEVETIVPGSTSPFIHVCVITKFEIGLFKKSFVP
jgi:hypothetical protein